MEALGMIETKGFVCMLEAVDSMLKAQSRSRYQQSRSVDADESEQDTDGY